MNIDLSQLPPPEFVEQLDYESIFAAAIQDFYNRMDTLGIEYSKLRESDPAYKLAEVFAYREMLIRNKANESAKAVLLAFSSGTDLEHKAAERGLTRRTISAATATEAAVMETDDLLRQRVQMAPESYTTAGSEGSYIYHAKNADVRIKDVQVHSPSEGIVSVYVLSTIETGIASEELLDIVNAALNVKEIRPLTDHVNVYTASIVNYQIEAVIKIMEGPDASVVLADAQATLKSYVDSMHILNTNVSISGIYRALHRPGVESVDLIQPASNVEIALGQASFCTSIALTTEGVT